MADGKGDEGAQVGDGEEMKKLGDGWCWGQYMAGPGDIKHPKLAKTGEGLYKLRERLRNYFPPTEIAKFPRDKLLKVICCVRCGDVPYPDDALSCEQGHYTCDSCVKAGLGNKEKTRKCKLKPCCADLGSLNQDGIEILKILVKSCKFKCRNHEKGCEESLDGDMIEEHFENCKYTELVKCRFNQCTEKYPYLDDVLEHYKQVHQATILEESGNSIKLPPIDFKQTLAQRLCAILKIEGLYYIFGCEVVSGLVFLWMWSMEHPATAGGTGLKTDAWYNMKLKMPPGKVLKKKERALGCFEGRCLVHSVDPEVICKTGGGIVDAFHMEVDLFKQLFVNEDDHGGNGGWTVAVLVKSLEKPRK